MRHNNKLKCWNLDAAENCSRNAGRNSHGEIKDIPHICKNSKWTDCYHHHNEPLSIHINDGEAIAKIHLCQP